MILLSVILGAGCLWYRNLSNGVYLGIMVFQCWLFNHPLCEFAAVGVLLTIIALLKTDREV